MILDGFSVFVEFLFFLLWVCRWQILLVFILIKECHDFPFIPEGYFAGYRILDWQFLTIWKTLSSCLWPPWFLMRNRLSFESVFSKNSVSFELVFPKSSVSFLSYCFQEFFFVFCFQKFMKFLDMDFLGFIHFRVPYNFLNLGLWLFPNLGSF